MALPFLVFFFFSSRRRHTRSLRDWSSDVCSSDLPDNLDPDEQVKVKDIRTRCPHLDALAGHVTAFAEMRSEERRVGKECRSRWSPYHEKKKENREKSDT